MEGRRAAHPGRCARPAVDDLFGVGAPYDTKWHTPVALDAVGLKRVKQAFVDAVERSARLGFDLIELHGAHGYLPAPVPLAAQQPAQRRVWRHDGEAPALSRSKCSRPAASVAARQGAGHAPLGDRLGRGRAHDRGHDRDGQPAEGAGLRFHRCELGRQFAGPQKIPVGPGYHVPFAARIRKEAGIKTWAVGIITEPEQAERIVASGEADCTAHARAFLLDPRWGWNAARAGRGDAAAALPAARAITILPFKPHFFCFTIVTGLFLYDFCLVPASDLNALAFFVCAIYMSLNFLKNDKKKSGYAVQIAVINFLCPFLRYMFIPVSLIIPIYLLFIGIKTRDTRIRKGGIVALIVTITLLCGLLIFQQTYTGQATYLPPDLKGFFPSNLFRWYPIVTSAFTNVWFYYSLAELAGVLHYGQYFEVIWGINILLFTLLLYLLARFYQKRKWSYLSLTDHYVYIGSAASLTIMALLIALSLRNAPLGKGFSRWTYLLEPRYMSFIVVFLQQLIFIFIFTRWKQIKNNVLRFAGIVIAILLSLEVIHGSYITSKIILSNKEYFHPPMKYLKQMEFVKYLIHQFKKESPGYDIIFVSTNINYCNAACLENAKTMCGFELPDNIPATPKHSILIAVVEDEEKNKFAWFVNKPTVRIIKTIDNVNFYEYRTDK